VDSLDGLPRWQYQTALNAEGVRAGTTYDPVYSNGLLNLYDKTSPIPFRDPAKVQNYAELRLPNTERAVRETAIVMSHQLLLAETDQLDQVVSGIAKVNANLDSVRKHFADSPA